MNLTSLRIGATMPRTTVSHVEPSGEMPALPLERSGRVFVVAVMESEFNSYYLVGFSWPLPHTCGDDVERRRKREIG